MMIRPARADDRAALLALLQPVIAGGETYALDRDMSAEAILDYWLGAEKDTFVAESDGVVLGTYYLRANQAGGGRHVANCGYVTSGKATGRGVARAMCRHSLDHARTRGFRAMQFNCVVSTNTRAVALWQAMGFEIVGRLPGAFEHPEQGPVDAFVMFQTL
ncbi:acetyltransferase [Aureimonas ureilytica]|uniref:Acetyltransferase n=1 Tax=Aureimonas ureilytica TaxID=401562 RepID=A0A175RWP5_9HYPH|nr:GNAT family N-acetyltransferase [Aureimonas ureilytica]KTR07891.1 acetyltransferase [Aureimonas ureilytica]